ncbi:MAG TPA: CinA family protein [Aldersonia sp.]
MVADQGVDELAEQIAELAGAADFTVAAAESLTGGRISAALGAAPDAGSWYRGAVVAYAEGVKREVLGVPECPVVSRACAQQMAEGVARLLDADYAVAVTGVGGPGSQDGETPGTVWFAVTGPIGTQARRHRFDGESAEIIDLTVAEALRLLIEHATTRGS